ncbi:MAG: antirestriction protein ArdA [Caulobacteraceae bacterium]
MDSCKSTSVEVFVANLNIYNSGNIYGCWLKLPVEEKLLMSQMESILDDDKEYIILGIKAPFKCKISRNTDIYKLNQSLITIQQINPDTLQAVADYDNLNLDEILDIIEKNRYVIYNNVSNEKDLGYELYLKNQLPFNIPKYLVDYVDFEAIGHDECIKKSIHIIPDRHIAERILPKAKTV